MTLRHLNPDGMASSPAFSQGVLVSEPGDLLVVGGQNGVGRLTIYLVAGPDVRVGYEAAQRVWGAHPTAVSVLQVAGLARPDCLVEIDALAQVPTRLPGGQV